MSVIGTYNGVSILALPDSPAPRQIQLSVNDSIAAPANPFTGATQQILRWPGGDRWTAQIALPKLRPSELPVWSAFVAECRGMLNTFQLGDSSYKGPRGNVRGSTPLVDGAQAPLADTLNVRGLKPNTARVLEVGDYLQLGYRLHRVLSAVNSDANGKATVTLWPSTREALTDGQSVILKNPRGLFRMAANKQSITVDQTRLGALTFDVVEAK